MECVFHLDEVFLNYVKNVSNYFIQAIVRPSTLLEFKKELNHNLDYLLKQKKTKRWFILVCSSFWNKTFQAV